MIIKFYKKAIQDLRKIEKHEKVRIRDGIKPLERFPKCHADIRPIRGVTERINNKQLQVWRLRVGNYRIMFVVYEDEIWILRILQRKKAYKR